MMMLSLISRVWWGGDPDERDPLSGLSRRDVYNVRRSWTQIHRAAYENGYLMFTRMFIADAETKTFFKFLDETTEQEMAQSVIFRAHIVNLMSALDSAVKHLGEAPEVSAQIMRKLGESHRRRKIQRKHFGVLREVLMGLLQNELALSADAVASWVRFVDFIYRHIFETLKE